MLDKPSKVWADRNVCPFIIFRRLTSKYSASFQKIPVDFQYSLCYNCLTVQGAMATLTEYMKRGITNGKI